MARRFSYGWPRVRRCFAGSCRVLRRTPVFTFAGDGPQEIAYGTEEKAAQRFDQNDAQIELTKGSGPQLTGPAGGTQDCVVEKAALGRHVLT
jgi:hypothetical protein